MLLLRVGWVRGRLGIVRSIYICLVTKLYNIKLGSDVKLVNYIVVTCVWLYRRELKIQGVECIGEL